MYNHFLRFNNENSAKAALSEYLIGSEWNETITIPNQKIVISRAEYEYDDLGNGTEIEPEVTVPGYYVTISLPEINITLQNLANNACRLIGNFNTGELIYTAPDANTQLLATAIIEPVPAGAKYSFL